nr:Transposon TX1 uncharacterized 149 kDa protein [Ipomoea batatas]
MDRILVSDGWRYLFPGARAWVIEGSSSDHLPLYLVTQVGGGRRPGRHRRFENFLGRNPECVDVVREAWEVQGDTRPVLECVDRKVTEEQNSDLLKPIMAEEPASTALPSPRRWFVAVAEVEARHAAWRKRMAVRTTPCGGMAILSLSRLSPVSSGASSNVGRWRGWRKSLDNALFLLIDQRQRVDGDGNGRFPCFSLATDGRFRPLCFRSEQQQ